MDIRASGKEYRILRNLYNKTTLLTKDIVSINEDGNAIQPLIMVQDKEGKLVNWTKGFENVESFIKYGYVRIRKQCPYKIGKCICEKCQLYQIYNMTGDCAINWTAIMGMK